MTTYIDLQSFGPDEELARLRVALLHLEGQFLTSTEAADRLALLVPGDVVLCRPLHLPFWRIAPAGVTLRVVDEQTYEDPLRFRYRAWLSWALVQLGLTQGEATALVRAPPKSAKHQYMTAYKAAQVLAEQMEAQRQAVMVGEEASSLTIRADEPYDWRVVTDENHIDFIEQLRIAAALNLPVGIDIEADVVGSSGPNEMKDRLVGLSIAFGDEGTDCYYIEADRITLEVWQHIANLKIVGANLKWDIAIMSRASEGKARFTADNVAGDSMLASYLLCLPAGLKQGVHTEFDVQMITYADITEGGRKNISEVPVEDVARYCCGDSYWALRLEKVLRKRLREVNPQAYKLYVEVDLPLIPVLVNMELRGVGFDRDKAKQELVVTQNRLVGLSDVLNEIAIESGYKQPDSRRVCKECRNGKIKRQTCEACQRVGVFHEAIPFNPGSDKQVREWLHGTLGLPIQAVSKKTNEPSVGSLSLLRLQGRHPAPSLLLSYRQLDKYRSYLEDWLAESEQDGRLHSVYTNAFVKSGRLSSRDPNLQQVKLDWRGLFGVCGTADYAQIEVRVAAFLSRDPVLMRVVNADPSTPEGDLHAQTMYNIFGIPFADQPALKHIRIAAKCYNFASLYGGREMVVVEQVEKRALEEPDLHIPIPSLSEARKKQQGLREMLRVYFQEYIPFVIYNAKEHNNTAFTAFGRPRTEHALMSLYKEEREAAERELVNHTIQGTVADMIRMAMNIIEEVPHGCMLTQVHDEIPFWFDNGWGEWYSSHVRTAMELGQPLEGVPIIIDIGLGDTWLNCHK